MKVKENRVRNSGWEWEVPRTRKENMMKLEKSRVGNSGGIERARRQSVLCPLERIVPRGSYFPEAHRKWAKESCIASSLLPSLVGAYCNVIICISLSSLIFSRATSAVNLFCFKNLSCWYLIYFKTHIEWNVCFVFANSLKNAHTYTWQTPLVYRMNYFQKWFLLSQH